MVILWWFKNGDFDSCEGDDLMTDASLWPIMALSLLMSEVKSSASGGTSAEWFLKAELKLCGTRGIKGIHIHYLNRSLLEFKKTFFESRRTDLSFLLKSVKVLVFKTT